MPQTTAAYRKADGLDALKFDVYHADFIFVGRFFIFVCS